MVGLAEVTGSGVEDVPDISVEWYRDITEMAGDTPAWFRSVADIATQGIIVFLGLVLLLAWWRARRVGPRAVLFALLAPAATAVVYALSEIVKSLWQEERPCRALANVVTISPCPAPGDWSFPSNHSVIAGAAAATVILSWRRLAAVVVPIALVEAASRVFVGAHYPHDVVVGLLFGGILAPLLALALARPLRPLVERLHAHPLLWRAVATSPLTPAPDPAVEGAQTVQLRRVDEPTVRLRRPGSR